MIIPLQPDDPAYWMLERGRTDPSWRSTPVVYLPGCYICEDDEFMMMGLPLCRECLECANNNCDNGHIPADDDVCSCCGATDNPHYAHLNDNIKAH